MSGSVPSGERFEVGLEAWLSGLGMIRDAVRQELVSRQLAAHLYTLSEPVRVLDTGCGQGTQAIALARLGHEVVGIDLSDLLLEAARDAAANEPSEVRQRLTFEVGDLLALGEGHVERYDVVCCHGVAMYLRSLDDTVRALARVARPGGLISLLTRNRAGLAMRAGMTAKWTECIEAFDARTYDNRLGIEAVRADEPNEVQAAPTVLVRRPWPGTGCASSLITGGQNTQVRTSQPSSPQKKRPDVGIPSGRWQLLPTPLRDAKTSAADRLEAWRDRASPDFLPDDPRSVGLLRGSDQDS